MKNIFIILFGFIPIASFSQETRMKIEEMYISGMYEFTLTNYGISDINIYPFGTSKNKLVIKHLNGQTGSITSSIPAKSTTIKSGEENTFQIDVFFMLEQWESGIYTIQWVIETAKGDLTKSNTITVNKPKNGFRFNDLSLTIKDNSTLDDFKVSVKNNRKEDVIISDFPTDINGLVVETPSGKKFIIYDDDVVNSERTIILKQGEEKEWSINLRTNVFDKKTERYVRFLEDTINEKGEWKITLIVNYLRYINPNNQKVELIMNRSFKSTPFIFQR